MSDRCGITDRHPRPSSARCPQAAGEQPETAPEAAASSLRRPVGAAVALGVPVVALAAPVAARERAAARRAEGRTARDAHGEVRTAAAATVGAVRADRPVAAGAERRARPVSSGLTGEQHAPTRRAALGVKPAVHRAPRRAARLRQASEQNRAVERFALKGRAQPLHRWTHPLPLRRASTSATASAMSISMQPRRRRITSAIASRRCCRLRRSVRADTHCPTGAAMIADINAWSDGMEMPVAAPLIGIFRAVSEPEPQPQIEQRPIARFVVSQPHRRHRHTSGVRSTQPSIGVEGVGVPAVMSGRRSASGGRLIGTVESEHRAKAGSGDDQPTAELDNWDFSALGSVVGR
jgi:hypothetical protein